MKKVYLKTEITLTSYEISSLVILLLCVLYSISTYFWSDYGWRVLPGAIPFLAGIVSVVVAKHWFKNGIDGYIIANRLLLVSIVVQLLMNFDFSYVNNFNILKSTSSTLMGKSNYISMFLGFIFLFELIAKRKYWFWFTLISVAGLILSLSKGAIISISAALLLYLLILLFKRNKLRNMVGLVFVIGIAFLLLTKTQIGNEFLSSLNFAMQNKYTSGRTLLLEKAFAQIAQKPFGNGVIIDDDPHNFIVRSWRDLGILIGTLYTLYLSHPVWNLFKRKIRNVQNTTLGLLIAYFSVVFHALAEIFYFNSPSIVWTVFTLMALNKIMRAEKVNNQSDTRVQ